jgi:hypothetical protein
LEKIMNGGGTMNRERLDHEKIEKVAKELMNKGIPLRASTFAAAMGYLRYIKDEKKNE